MVSADEPSAESGLNRRIFAGVKRHAISELLDTALSGRMSPLRWVRTFRNNQFLSVNDGSCLGNLQLVLDREGTEEALLKRLTTGAPSGLRARSWRARGRPGHEVDVTGIEVLGDADPRCTPSR